MARNGSALSPFVPIPSAYALEPADREAYAKAPMNLMQKRLAATIGAGGQQAAKYDRLRDLLGHYREEGRKVVLFSFFSLLPVAVEPCAPLSEASAPPT